jgi:4-diphosphocytidyl-2-C-methyl-D-erythritol kinase
MVCFPHCKINLGLHILSKRPDGYHALETCFYPVPWTDILEIIHAKEFSFVLTGLPVTDSAEGNLCVKAYRLLQQDHGITPVCIHLHKILPPGAGLGGGSSDAAHTLRLLNELFSLDLSAHVLRDYASRLGSDCAFFIEDQPSLGAGRGEELHEITVELKNKYLVLVKPPVSVSTAEAYKNVIPCVPESGIREILARDIHDWKELLHNDFEKSVFQRYPEIGLIKEKLYNRGAVYASMSGSGSSVFGIFDRELNLREEFPEATYWSGFLTA